MGEQRAQGEGRRGVGAKGNSPVTGFEVSEVRLGVGSGGHGIGGEPGEPGVEAGRRNDFPSIREGRSAQKKLKEPLPLPTSDSFSSFKSQPKCHLLREACPWHLGQSSVVSITTLYLFAFSQNSDLSFIC